FRAVILRRVTDQAAPTAADVEQLVAGTEIKFTADQFKLRRLRVGQTRFRRLEIRARVEQTRIKPKQPKFNRQIIVKGNRFFGTLAARPALLWMEGVTGDRRARERFPQ